MSSDHEEEDLLRIEENKIREALKRTSFETLLKLREDPGQNPEIRNQITTLRKQRAAASKKAKANEVQKKSKNQPVERSAKIPVSRFQTVIEPRKPKGRDPRFDNLSGHLNEDLFRESYQFLVEKKQKEIEVLSKEMKKKKYKPEEKEKIQRAIAENKSDLGRTRESELKKQVKKEMKDKIKQNIQSGKGQFFFKKGVFKTRLLQKKFEKLDNKKKLQSKLNEKKHKITKRMAKDMKILEERKNRRDSMA